MHGTNKKIPGKLLTAMGIVLKVSSKKAEGFFCGVFPGKIFPGKTPPAEQPTKCMWASHQLLWASNKLLVGIPVIVIRQPGSNEAGVSPLRNLGEQLRFQVNWFFQRARLSGQAAVSVSGGIVQP
jgi:hypothetical protein